MKRSPLSRRTPLSRGTPLKKRNEKRAREAFRRTFGPPGFSDFVRNLPCVLCGDRPSVPHHDPTRKSGGTWVDVSPVCRTCHNEIRHGLNGGVKRFWREVGMDYAESNRRTQSLWLARAAA